MISYICKNLYVGGNYFMREKILSMILALSMLCAFVPMTASAETYENYLEYWVNEDNTVTI